MDKPKYIKPVVEDLSSVQIADGNCKSGGTAAPGKRCTGGGDGMVPGLCTSGGSALSSCLSGSTAG